MPIDEVFVSSLPGDRRAAACRAGALVRLLVPGDAARLRRGDLVLGRIQKTAPSIGGAFVDLGSGPSAVLMWADAPDGRPLAEGEPVLARITREADAEKGAKLTARLAASERQSMPAGVSPPHRLEPAPDPLAALLRAAAGGLRRCLVDDAAALNELRFAVPEAAAYLQLWNGPGTLFAAHGIDGQIDEALSPQVALPSGGRLIIAETPAATTIDVDTGAVAGVSARAAAIVCNLEAAEAIGRELVLREIGGRIVVDFIPLRQRSERERVLEALRRSFAGDERKLRLGGWTRLGLVELIRQRYGPSLASRLRAGCCSSAEACRPRVAWWTAGAALRAALAEARDTPGLTPLLTAPPSVIAEIKGPLADALAAVEAKLGCAIRLVETADLAADEFRLSPAAGSGR